MSGHKAGQVEFDGRPGMRCQQITEIIGQLRFGQVVYLMIEIFVGTPYAMGINGFGLETLEFQVFEVGLVIFLNIATLYSLAV
jgi:hypothetical protein